jgi:hypothetical protein
VNVRYLELLEALAAHCVDFIIVGGVAAVLEGAPITTLDLDILYDSRAENHERLLSALQDLDARLRDPAGREIRPDPARLRSLRMGLLETRLGPLDILSEVGDHWAYDDLLNASIERTVGDLRVRVLGLGKLIEIKELANREKDRAMLPLLRRTLQLKGE